MDTAPVSPDVAPLTAAAVQEALTAAGGAPLGRVEVVARAGSTSTDLLAAAAADPTGWPDRSVLVTDHQTAGRGRSGRVWETPPGEALTFSVLLRPRLPPQTLGWLTLLGGLAVVRALEDLGLETGLKWPNDVLVVDAADPLPGWGRHRKVAGILGELGPAAPADGDAGSAAGPGVVAVLGLGVNVHQRALPVPSATSLAACGVDVGRAELLARVLAHLGVLDERWRGADGDACAADLAAECAAVCLTLGAQVRVSLPGGQTLTGRAIGLSDHGALRVVDEQGSQHTVLAGDVEHVRA